MSVEQNKAVMRRMFELLNLGDNDLFFKYIDENYADDYIFHGAIYAGFERGPEGMKKCYTHFMSTSTKTDRHYSIEDMFGEGDKVVTRYIFRYTDAGKSGAGQSINITHFAGGKIADEWDISEPLPESVPT